MPTRTRPSRRACGSHSRRSRLRRSDAVVCVITAGRRWRPPHPRPLSREGRGANETSWRSRSRNELGWPARTALFRHFKVANRVFGQRDTTPLSSPYEGGGYVQSMREIKWRADGSCERSGNWSSRLPKPLALVEPSRVQPRWEMSDSRHLSRRVGQARASDWWAVASRTVRELRPALSGRLSGERRPTAISAC
jgi:hypothetical protein